MKQAHVHTVYWECRQPTLTLAEERSKRHELLFEGSMHGSSEVFGGWLNSARWTFHPIFKCEISVQLETEQVLLQWFFFIFITFNILQY